MALPFRPILLFATLALVACASDPPLEVAKVDLAMFQGPWYEIAKIPRATQAHCTGTIAYYRLKSDTELDVFNECREGSLDGPLRRMAARAVVTNPDVPAKLSLDVGGIFGDYWIVEVDDDYSRAAVGHPSRDFLWILDRSPSMPEAELEALVESMREKGFDVSRLERTLQDDRGTTLGTTSAPLPSTSAHGCSMAKGRTAGWLGALGLVLALGAAVLRRTRASTN